MMMKITERRPADRVRIARMESRPTTKEYIEAMIEDFLPLGGDRAYSEDEAIIGGIGSFHGIPVTVIGHQKGRSLEENLKRRFGMPNPDGYRKALRLMKQAEKFHRPVLCVVDTSGANCGIGAEERGQGQAIAENLMTMMSLDTPVITVLIGEGGSGGALALSVADRVWMLEHAVYSVISPEGCASILWKDAGKADEAAQSLKLTAKDALELGIIERILPEKELGNTAFYTLLADLLEKELAELQTQPDLLERRYASFRALGDPMPQGKKEH